MTEPTKEDVKLIIRVPEDAATLVEAMAKLPPEGGAIVFAEGHSETTGGS